MSKSNPNTSSNISLDTIIKYLKGNLLGEKKKNTEFEIEQSDFVREAVEGIAMVQNQQKLPKTIQTINEKIAYKTKAAVFDPSQESSAGAPVEGFWFVPLSIAALLIVAVGLWMLISNIDFNKSNDTGIASMSEEKPVFKQEQKENSIAPITDSIEPLIALNSEDETESNEVTSDQQFIPLSQTNESNIQKPESKQLTTPIVPKEKKNEISKVSKADAENSRKLELATSTADKSAEALKAEEDKEENVSGNALSKPESYGNYKDKQTDNSVKVAMDEAATNPEKAIILLQEIADEKSNPESEKAEWELANLLIKQGRVKEAKKALKKIERTSKYHEMAKSLLKDL